MTQFKVLNNLNLDDYVVFGTFNYFLGTVKRFGFDVGISSYVDTNNNLLCFPIVVGYTNDLFVKIVVVVLYKGNVVVLNSFDTIKCIVRKGVITDNMPNDKPSFVVLLKQVRM